MRGHVVASIFHNRMRLFEFGSGSAVFEAAREELGGDAYPYQAVTADSGHVNSRSDFHTALGSDLRVLEAADTILLLGWPDESLAASADLIELLRRARARGCRFVGGGAGVFVLGAAGLLDGRCATTHWTLASELMTRFPEVKLKRDALYVDDGDLVTSAGSAANVDMLLHLIRRDHGVDVSGAVARRLAAPPHRHGDQAQYLQSPVPPFRKSRLSLVVEHLELTSTKSHRIADLAAMAAMSPRSFYRKFKDSVGLAPYEYIVRRRIEAAKGLLEKDQLCIDQISDAVGFGSTETFRHHFRRLVGTSPAEYRRGEGCRMLGERTHRLYLVSSAGGLPDGGEPTHARAS